MKKIINITLGGIVFAIEQDAYDALVSYLENIKKTFSSTDDNQEIVDDIEAAIAEKFSARNRSEKKAVTSEDVSSVISEMGSPDQFGEETHEAEEKSPQEEEMEGSHIKKRLYRDSDDVIIAGVASGLAKYFSIDPVIVRLIFVISVFFNGIGILAYIALWFIVPKAETTTQKYAMRGEKVTLKEITEQVKKNIRSADITQAAGLWSSTRVFLGKLFEVLGMIITLCLRVLRYVVGALLILVGAIALAGTISVYSIVLFSDKVLFPYEAQTALGVLFGTPLGLLAITSSFLMVTIPMIVLILSGGSLLAKRSLLSVAKGITLAVVWIVAIILAFTTSALQVEQVMQKLGVENFDEGKYQIHINMDEDKGSVDIDVSALEEENVKSAPPASEVKELPDSEPTACTMDAKMCPDGSFVGRSGPKCEFAACPGGGQ